MDMMSGCFSPPGGGDPWGQDYEDDRLYRMSARKFNKHMAEKRRRCRINTALERLKYIILHVMRRNPEHFDKMEKADILDLTVKFLRAVQKHEGPLGGARPPPAHSHHQRPHGAARHTAQSVRIYEDPAPAHAQGAPTETVTRAHSHHQQQQQQHPGKERAFGGLKTRSVNIPSAVVRAVQETAPPGVLPSHSSDDVRSPHSAVGEGTSGLRLPYRSPVKRSSSSSFTASEGCPPRKRPTTSAAAAASSAASCPPSSLSSSSASFTSPSGRDFSDDIHPFPFGRNLEYRVHSAFQFHPRSTEYTPMLFHPIPKRPKVTSVQSAAIVAAASSSSSTFSASFDEAREKSASAPPSDLPANETAKVRLPETESAEAESKTSALSIDIPEVGDDAAVPPLQPVDVARGQHSPQEPLLGVQAAGVPLPQGAQPSAMWRPW